LSAGGTVFGWSGIPFTFDRIPHWATGRLIFLDALPAEALEAGPAESESDNHEGRAAIKLYR